MYGAERHEKDTKADIEKLRFEEMMKALWNLILIMDHGLTRLWNKPVPFIEMEKIAMHESIGQMLGGVYPEPTVSKRVMQKIRHAETVKRLRETVFKDHVNRRNG